MDDREESNSSGSCCEEDSVRHVVSPEQRDSMSPNKGHRKQRPFSGKGKFLRSKKGSSSTIMKLPSNDRRVNPSNGQTEFPNSESISDRGFNQSHVNKRFNQRRQRERKWKPYHLLTTDERRQRDQLETKRAEEKRNRRTTLGFPQAPYNTTQFLMNDHKSEHETTFQEPVLVSSDESNDAQQEDEVALDRGYDQEWERVFTNNLSRLSKDGLIDYALRTEREKGDLERRLRKLEQELQAQGTDGSFSDDMDDGSRTRSPVPVRAESV